MSDLVQILVNKGVSPSIQRLKVYQFLMGTKSHPRVNDIYQALKSDIPSLSKTTVYNVVKLFVFKGLINELHIDSNEVRYDAFVQDHGHFKCKICGSITDIYLDNSIGNLKIVNKRIDTIELNIIGICEKCLN